MWNIFINKKLNKQFSHKGYVKFQLFDDKEIEQIRNFYFDNIDESQRSQSVHSFHATSCTSDISLIKEVDAFLKPFFLKALKFHIKNCKFIITNYLVKESTKNSQVTPHLDLSFVDEPQNVSFNVWVSLDDCNENSGNLQVVEGSHRFYNGVRVSPDQPKYFDDFQDKLNKYLKNIPTKAGECIVFHHNLIHASSKNKSGKPRVSCIISGYNINTQLYHFFYDKSNPRKIEKYSVETLSFLELIHDQRPPHSELREIIDYIPYKMPYKEFKAKIVNFHGGTIKYVLFLLKNKFKYI
jgi:hypothetical protein